MKIIKNKVDIFELLKSDGGKYAVTNIDDAYTFCKHISLNHYENFPVGSILIPSKFRRYFFSIYCFARLADDIADELYKESSVSRIDALNNLNYLIQNPDNYLNLNKFNPILLALSHNLRVVLVLAFP